MGPRSTWSARVYRPRRFPLQQVLRKASWSVVFLKINPPPSGCVLETRETPNQVGRRIYLDRAHASRSSDVERPHASKPLHGRLKDHQGPRPDHTSLALSGSQRRPPPAPGRARRIPSESARRDPHGANDGTPGEQLALRDQNHPDM